MYTVKAPRAQITRFQGLILPATMCERPEAPVVGSLDPKGVNSIRHVSQSSGRKYLLEETLWFGGFCKATRIVTRSRLRKAAS